MRRAVLALAVLFVAACATGGDEPTDAATRDAPAPRDGGRRDASVRDAAARDAGTRDATVVVDGSTRDASMRDGGPPDAGRDAGPPDAGRPDGGPPTIPATWATTATSYTCPADVGRRFVYSCPAGGPAGSIWGTDVYTHDSSICTAAVHVGRITLAAGGVITMEMAAGQASYTSSTRNGITSGSWGSWGCSFTIL